MTAAERRVVRAAMRLHRFHKAVGYAKADDFFATASKEFFRACAALRRVRRKK